MSECPRCARDRIVSELERRHAWRDGQRSVVLVCNVCGYKAVEPRPVRDVQERTSEEADNESGLEDSDAIETEIGLRARTLSSIDEPP